MSCTFITNHGAALVLMARERRITTREMARRLEIGERAAQRIVAQLEAAGYIAVRKEGRRNCYRVRYERPMRRKGLQPLSIREGFLAYVRMAEGEADTVRRGG